MRPMPTSDASAPSIAEPPLQTAVPRLRASLERLAARIETLLDRERDQLPLWLPVGLGLGIAAWFALPDAGAWIAFLFAAAAGIVAPLAVSPGARSARALAIFSLAAMLGCGLIWWKAERVATPRIERAQMAEFTGTIVSSQRLPARKVLRLVVRPIAARNLPPRLRINVDETRAGAGLVPGATVRIRTWLMPPAPMAVPGTFDFARMAWFQGIGGTGRAIGTSALWRRPPSRAGAPASPRRGNVLPIMFDSGCRGRRGRSRQHWPLAINGAYRRRMPRRCADPGLLTFCR
jgi:competence protein ComEC